MTTQDAILQLQDVQSYQHLAGAGSHRITRAIQRASANTGVDFAYLMNKAAQESSYNANAKASSSSATGLYQFTQQTWLQMLKNHGEEYGLDDVAAQIRQRADGSLAVDNLALRRQVLNLRKNPELSAAFAAELAGENKEVLENRVGGKINNTDLYIAHFLGAGAAAQFIEAKRANPQTIAAELFPEAAQANPSVFYAKDGSPRTVNDIYMRFAKTINRTPVMPETMVAAAEPAAPLMTPIANAAKSMASDKVNFTAYARGTEPQPLFTTLVLAQLDSPGETLMKAEGALRGEREENNRRGLLQRIVG